MNWKVVVHKKTGELFIMRPVFFMDGLEPGSGYSIRLVSANQEPVGYWFENDKRGCLYGVEVFHEFHNVVLLGDL